MSDYKSSILQLLAELGGTAPTDIVLSDAEWKAAVLTMLGEIADGGGGGGGGGGGASVLVVNVTEVDGTYTCDKTAAEMWAAVPLVCFKYQEDDADYIRCLFEAGHDEENGYQFTDSSGNRFEAASGTDYPTYGGIS